MQDSIKYSSISRPIFTFYVICLLSLSRKKGRKQGWRDGGRKEGKIFLSQKHLRTDCRNHVPLSLNTLIWILKKKVILLHNYSPIIKIRKFNMLLLSNPQSIFTLCQFSYPGSHIVFSCHVSLISFNLREFLSLSVCFSDLMFLKSTRRVFVECLSIWVCLMFPHN